MSIVIYDAYVYENRKVIKDTLIPMLKKANGKYDDVEKIKIFVYEDFKGMEAVEILNNFKPAKVFVGLQKDGICKTLAKHTRLGFVSGGRMYESREFLMLLSLKNKNFYFIGGTISMHKDNYDDNVIGFHISSENLKQTESGVLQSFNNSCLAPAIVLSGLSEKLTVNE